MPVAAFLIVALYLVAINLATAVTFAWDKYRATHDQWRITERTLLTMAAAGGSIGAIVASERLRHKTYKEPFRTYLRLILWAHAVMLAAIVVLIVWRLLPSDGGG